MIPPRVDRWHLNRVKFAVNAIIIWKVHPSHALQFHSTVQNGTKRQKTDVLTFCHVTTLAKLFTTPPVTEKTLFNGHYIYLTSSLRPILRLQGWLAASHYYHYFPRESEEGWQKKKVNKRKWKKGKVKQDEIVRLKWVVQGSGFFFLPSLFFSLVFLLSVFFLLEVILNHFLV